jgi:hypothetical protein
MASRKQILANRANAKRSTGPKTPKGKRESSKNAFKYGLYSRDVVTWDEDPLEFERLRASLQKIYPPINALIVELVDHLAGLFWRIRRPPKLEAGIFGARGTLTLAFNDADPESRQKALERLGQLRQARGQEDDSETGFYKDLGPALWREIPEIVTAFMGGEKNQELLTAVARHETSLRNGIARTLAMLHALGAGPVGATRT